MKVIYWIGGAVLVAASTVGIWLSTAQAGDAIIRRVDTKVLSGAQKTALVNAVKCDVPSFSGTGVGAIGCEVARATGQADVWTCRTRSDVVMTEANYVVALAHGTVGPYNPGSRTGGNVTVPAISNPATISAGCVSGWDTWLGSVYSGATMGATERFACIRHAAAPTQIDCSATRLVTMTAAAYLNAGGGSDNGPELVGVVE